MQLPSNDIQRFSGWQVFLGTVIAVPILYTLGGIEGAKAVVISVPLALCFVFSFYFAWLVTKTFAGYLVWCAFGMAALSLLLIGPMSIQYRLIQSGGSYVWAWFYEFWDTVFVSASTVLAVGVGTMLVRAFLHGIRGLLPNHADEAPH